MDYADQSYWALTKRLNCHSDEEIEFNLQTIASEDTVIAFQLGFEAAKLAAAELAGQADARIAELEAKVEALELLIETLP